MGNFLNIQIHRFLFPFFDDASDHFLEHFFVPKKFHPVGAFYRRECWLLGVSISPKGT
jgi:hypothetical protein